MAQEPRLNLLSTRNARFLWKLERDLSGEIDARAALDGRELNEIPRQELGAIFELLLPRSIRESGFL